MGPIQADIRLSNPRRPGLRGIAVKALADTGALMPCLPAHLAIQLDLATESAREVRVADGGAVVGLAQRNPMRRRANNRRYHCCPGKLRALLRNHL